MVKIELTGQGCLAALPVPQYGGYREHLNAFQDVIKLVSSLNHLHGIKHQVLLLKVMVTFVHRFAKGKN